MLAFDFRLIYNPPRLRLGGLFRKQTMVVGGGGCGTRVPWTSPSPSGSWRCRSWVSWFCSISSEFSVPASANTQGTRLSHCMEMRCRKTAFPKESIASSVLSRDLGRRRGEDGWETEGLHPSAHSQSSNGNCSIRFREVLEWTVGSLLEFVASSVWPFVHGFILSSIHPSNPSSF